ncbi:MAG: MOSC domain-containing protein [Spirochaetaceae bacterium]|jgi:TatD DNase family protein|nr:MOSC domain-containing protein [Spirochaetaceae bacterium]
MEQQGEIIAVCVSEKKGVAKVDVGQRKVIENFGLEGDAHGAQNFNRQVSLISADKIIEFEKTAGIKVARGAFGENFIATGIDFATLPLGTKFLLGDGVELELTQIGKECHDGCSIKAAVGKCIMPKEGVFCKVLKGGNVKVGDKITVLS